MALQFIDRFTVMSDDGRDGIVVARMLPVTEELTIAYPNRDTLVRLFGDEAWKAFAALCIAAGLEIPPRFVGDAVSEKARPQ